MWSSTYGTLFKKETYSWRGKCRKGLLFMACWSSNTKQEIIAFVWRNNFERPLDPKRSKLFLEHRQG
ncbi:hypothetical protein DPMN_147150 [Dreissena polymorpha]|uniref:Uncharacterized protein n=1 Tax=Dreissena polymorpha TaxID=45954 RepID=A0A9D4FBN4_DREPO|nr:hypothetical protein DPMN_147150 [Dreissena polymorpha]